MQHLSSGSGEVFGGEHGAHNEDADTQSEAHQNKRKHDAISGSSEQNSVSDLSSNDVERHQHSGRSIFITPSEDPKNPFTLDKFYENDPMSCIAEMEIKSACTGTIGEWLTKDDHIVQGRGVSKTERQKVSKQAQTITNAISKTLFEPIRTKPFAHGASKTIYDANRDLYHVIHVLNQIFSQAEYLDCDTSLLMRCLRGFVYQNDMTKENTGEIADTIVSNRQLFLQHINITAYIFGVHANATPEFYACYLDVEHSQLRGRPFGPAPWFMLQSYGPCFRKATRCTTDSILEANFISSLDYFDNLEPRLLAPVKPNPLVASSTSIPNQKLEILYDGDPVRLMSRIQHLEAELSTSKAQLEESEEERRLLRGGMYVTSRYIENSGLTFDVSTALTEHKKRQQAVGESGRLATELAAKATELENVYSDAQVERMRGNADDGSNRLELLQRELLLLQGRLADSRTQE